MAQPTTITGAAERPGRRVLRTLGKPKTASPARRAHMALDEQKDHAGYFSQSPDRWRPLLMTLQSL